MAAIVWRTEAIYELRHTNNLHVKTPTIVCDNCGGKFLQTRCRPWRRRDSFAEVLLCAGKKGCLTLAVNGGPLICYGETKLTPKQIRALAEKKLDEMVAKHSKKNPKMVKA